MARSGKSGKQREREPNSFPVQFGRLVRRYRVKYGLTQAEVAEKALGDEGRSSRVSDVERGRGEPRASTIQAFCLALGIPEDEVEACRTSPIPALPHEILADLDIAEGLAQNLAMRFGHPNPDAGYGALKDFLEQKAREYHATMERWGALAATESRVADQVRAAKDALDSGDFRKADEILKKTEEIQQDDRTLGQIRRQADIRAARGDAALLAGDIDAASTHFSSAAAFFDPFDRMEGAERRDNYCLRLYEHGRRSGGSGFAEAVALAERNLQIFAAFGDHRRWAVTQINLGAFYSSMGETTAGERGVEFLSRAIAADEAALRFCSSTHGPQAWAGTQNNLGNTLMALSARTQGAYSVNLLVRAVDAYRAALEVHTEEEHPNDWARTVRNLAGALRIQGKRALGDEGKDSLFEALAEYESVFRVFTRKRNPLEWARTKAELAIVLTNLGERTSGSEGKKLLTRATRAYETARHIVTREEHPAEWASISNNLGTAHCSLGERIRGKAATRHIEQAIDAYEAALLVRTREQHPLGWAETQHNLGEVLNFKLVNAKPADRLEILGRCEAAYKAVMSVNTENEHPREWAMAKAGVSEAYEAMAQGEAPNSQRHYLQQALSEIDDALTVFEPIGAGSAYASSQRTRDRIASRLAEIQPKDNMDK